MDASKEGLNMEKLRRLIVVWATVSLLSFVINGLGQFLSPPVPYTDDACLATCGHCINRYPIKVERWNCCRWDQGCWANPWEPDYQVSTCDRPVVFCEVVDAGGSNFYGYYCCDPAYNCSEIDGAPCCEPYHTHPCPQRLRRDERVEKARLNNECL